MHKGLDDLTMFAPRLVGGQPPKRERAILLRERHGARSRGAVREEVRRSDRRDSAHAEQGGTTTPEPPADRFGLVRPAARGEDHGQRQAGRVDDWRDVGVRQRAPRHPAQGIESVDIGDIGMTVDRITVRREELRHPAAVSLARRVRPGRLPGVGHEEHHWCHRVQRLRSGRTSGIEPTRPSAARGRQRRHLDGAGVQPVLSDSVSDRTAARARWRPLAFLLRLDMSEFGDAGARRGRQLGVPAGVPSKPEPGRNAGPILRSREVLASSSRDRKICIVWKTAVRHRAPRRKITAALRIWSAAREWAIVRAAMVRRAAECGHVRCLMRFWCACCCHQQPTLAGLLTPRATLGARHASTHAFSRSQARRGGSFVGRPVRHVDCARRGIEGEDP